MFETYPLPEELGRSAIFRLTVNGREIPVYPTGDAHFALLAWDEGESPLTFAVTTPEKIPAGSLILPRRKDITPDSDGNRLSFVLSRREKIAVEIPGHPYLFIWIQAPETERPVPGDPSVHYFASGKIHEVGVLELGDGETCYIEGGAVVRGAIEAFGKQDIRVCGHGILDGSMYSRAEGSSRISMLFGHCRNIDIRDLVMLRPSGWMIELGACEDAVVENVKQIGEVMCSDGIDIVGSRRVRVKDCFLRNNDDCVVIKACKKGHGQRGALSDFSRNVEDVDISGCLLANAHGGNAMELGFELAADHVRDIRFRDIDVISVEGMGAVFSIHNGDRAVIENIVFEDIRIDHCYDRFIDFRVLVSRYNVDEKRGHIRGIHLRDIEWRRNRFNAGSTISLIGGYDADHPVREVTFTNVRLDGQPIKDPDDLELHLRHAEAIRVQSS